jgi:hypothetical protein
MSAIKIVKIVKNKNVETYKEVSKRYQEINIENRYKK